MKAELGISYNIIRDTNRESKEEDGWCTEALESDSRLDFVVSLIDIIEFAVMADEWILALVAMEHMNRNEFKD